MADKEEYRIFVGGLSWGVTDRELESAFSRFGKIVDSQIMLERGTNRPRGFGFLTFADRRSMEDAIRDMHGRELGERVISVNKAQPKMGSEEPERGYGGGYPSSGGRSGYAGGDRSVGQDDCFKCGRPGHWARDCPSGDGRGSGRGFSPPRSRFAGAGARSDRYGGDRDRYADDRYESRGRYGDRDRYESRDDRYATRDRYATNDRYAPAGDRYATADRYGASDRYAQNGYGKERGGYDRDVGGPRGGNDRYGAAPGGGGPARYEGRSFNRDRPAPYDRPRRGPRPSSLEPRY